MPSPKPRRVWASPTSSTACFLPHTGDSFQPQRLCLGQILMPRALSSTSLGLPTGHFLRDSLSDSLTKHSQRISTFSLQHVFNLYVLRGLTTRHWVILEKRKGRVLILLSSVIRADSPQLNNHRNKSKHGVPERWITTGEFYQLGYLRVELSWEEWVLAE